MPSVIGSDSPSGIVMPGSYGVLGDSATGPGVAGSSTGIGVWGRSLDDVGPAVRGDNLGNGIGIFGEGVDGIGVWGFSTNSEGIVGYSSNSAGVRGESGAYYGVYGVVNKSGAAGVWARNKLNGTNAYLGTEFYAGEFYGKVYVRDFLEKPGGGFLVDHPLDPANKTFAHSFVESPDMKNIYDGVAVLEQHGEADVKLPAWFEAANRDFRYQLTCIGGHAPVYVAREIRDNTFTIAGGTPGLKVSWQVTGIRKDPWAAANRLVVEKDKPERERGFFLHPELFGETQEKSVHHVRHAALPKGDDLPAAPPRPGLPSR